MEAALRSLQDALKGNDLEAIRRAPRRWLRPASRSAGTCTSQAASSEFADDDEVVDAEIVDERQSA